MLPTGWTCPKCKRRFTRKNQRHACGTGDLNEVVRGRAPEIVATYQALLAFVNTLGKVEIVARERYVLFRSRKIFADAVVMVDAVRIAIHLRRRVEDPRFIKIVADERHVTHVAKLRGVEEIEGVEGYLREAYRESVG